jgi:hypothetical protein
MKGFFPFTDYDFWAYIASGFVFLFALDHSLETAIFQRPTWTLVEGLIAVSVAYVVGHLLAGFASAILEQRFVRKYLGPPSALLLGAARGPKWFRYLYPDFLKHYRKQQSIKFWRELAPKGSPSRVRRCSGWLTTICDKKKSTASRVSTFLNLYGLCRNLSMTAIFVTAMLIVSASYHDRPTDYWWATASAVLGCGMFLRYLKFYRHYSLEVFTAFAYSKSSKTKATTV